MEQVTSTNSYNIIITVDYFFSCFVVIEVTSGEYGDHNETLVKYIDNGKSNDWSKDKCIEDSK